ncbi:hypothetical protein J8273_6513 [Carpediemonas membranifera]|uniref:Uncharacterized protein n=1 Tax=Carpediemonas membranifera TaxID=201153 RepID=A0A8J6B7P1_9EUKA|nr:hypothetical protein J8273_6513 [Carpediemonas membranifera]|eukprot:KAG9391737.1 hypothetical protein J8273_6513 [Carpediemonas membranifera]
MIDGAGDAILQQIADKAKQRSYYTCRETPSPAIHAVMPNYAELVSFIKEMKSVTLYMPRSNVLESLLPSSAVNMIKALPRTVWATRLWVSEDVSQAAVTMLHSHHDTDDILECVRSAIGNNPLSPAAGMLEAVRSLRSVVIKGTKRAMIDRKSKPMLLSIASSFKMDTDDLELRLTKTMKGRVKKGMSVDDAETAKENLVRTFAVKALELVMSTNEHTTFPTNQIITTMDDDDLWAAEVIEAWVTGKHCPSEDGGVDRTAPEMGLPPLLPVTDVVVAVTTGMEPLQATSIPRVAVFTPEPSEHGEEEEVKVEEAVVQPTEVEAVEIEDPVKPSPPEPEQEPEPEAPQPAPVPADEPEPTLAGTMDPVPVADLEEATPQTHAPPVPEPEVTPAIPGPQTPATPSTSTPQQRMAELRSSLGKPPASPMSRLLRGRRSPRVESDSFDRNKVTERARRFRQQVEVLLKEQPPAPVISQSPSYVILNQYLDSIKRDEPVGSVSPPDSPNPSLSRPIQTLAAHATVGRLALYRHFDENAVHDTAELLGLDTLPADLPNELYPAAPVTVQGEPFHEVQGRVMRQLVDPTAISDLVDIGSRYCDDRILGRYGAD